MQDVEKELLKPNTLESYCMLKHKERELTNTIEYGKKNIEKVSKILSGIKKQIIEQNRNNPKYKYSYKKKLAELNKVFN